MHHAPEQRRGFCPTVWTPMVSGDGLIVRVRTSSRALSAGSIRTLVRSATRHGNGLIEITRRANLQLRGISASTLEALQAELVHEGLAEPTPDRERTLALIVDPLAGLSSHAAALDDVVLQLEQRLAAPAAAPLRSAMPDKLAIALEGGGYALRDLSADIRVRRTRAQPQLAFLSLDDPLELGQLGAVRMSEVAEAVMRLLEALSALYGEQALRMREAIASYGQQPFREALQGLLIEAAPPSGAEALEQALLGFHRGDRSWFGFGMPFGTGEAAHWLAAAALAERFGDGSLRTTPQRSLILSGVQAESHARLEREAKQAGFIVTADDVLARVIACTGAPACSAAFDETRPFAARLARALAPALARGTLHVSGCPKSCASGRQASITIVHQPEGCKVGFDADVATTMLEPTLSPAEAYDKLSAFERSSSHAPLHQVMSRPGEVIP